MPTTTHWFHLGRHDDPDPATLPPVGDPVDDGSEALGDKGKQALDRMKADRSAAKAEAAAERKRADELAAKVAEFEDRDKTELERATATSEAATRRAEAATARAVRAEVKALAADGFADPTDAAAFLDLTQYAGTDGEIDTDRIAADLADLLKTKPHLAKPVDGPRGPRPDPGQGARPPVPPTDFRTADRASFQAELARMGVRLHS
ncbi:hypothetical protein ACFZDG_18455 [Kitasatospora xanthocidica]|uniref:hypothetical protein n=1 Tax=Kitasatospora xanthocidica TaxID=83382 RepID=UPI0036EDA6C6